MATAENNMITPAENAATVREALDESREFFNIDVDAAEAALDALEAQAEEWMTPFDGSGIEWHEGLPNPYTYRVSDFSALVAAVHEYESRAEARLREAEAALADMETAVRNQDRAEIEHQEVLAERDVAVRLAQRVQDERDRLATEADKWEREFATAEAERDQRREDFDRLDSRFQSLIEERDRLVARVEELEAALREAEGWLTQGQGSPECHYALGIIRAALDKDTA